MFSFVLGILSLVGGYALFHPHVSLDPGEPLNPGDPFSTQFNVTNEKNVFSVHDLSSICWTESVETSNHVRIKGFGRSSPHSIFTLEPNAKSTLDCPPWISGFGAWAGDVTTAFIEIDISYKQDWWPTRQTEKYPFRGVRNYQGVVHWEHRTVSEQSRSDFR